MEKLLSYTCFLHQNIKKHLVCQDSWKLVQLFQYFIYLLQIFVAYHAAVENVSAKVTTLQWVEIIFKEFKLPGISWYIWFNQWAFLWWKCITHYECDFRNNFNPFHTFIRKWHTSQPVSKNMTSFAKFLLFFAEIVSFKEHSIIHPKLCNYILKKSQNCKKDNFS